MPHTEDRIEIEAVARSLYDWHITTFGAPVSQSWEHKSQTDRLPYYQGAAKVLYAVKVQGEVAKQRLVQVSSLDRLSGRDWPKEALGTLFKPVDDQITDSFASKLRAIDEWEGKKLDSGIGLDSGGDVSEEPMAKPNVSRKPDEPPHPFTALTSEVQRLEDTMKP